MSVLIKGMKMPKDCDTCKFSDINDCKLWAIMDVGEIHPECPLTELPEKHGRLFDTDEVVKCLEELPDNDEKAWAIGLLEWAIKKRWCIDAEGEG